MENKNLNTYGPIVIGALLALMITLPMLGNQQTATNTPGKAPEMPKPWAPEPNPENNSGGGGAISTTAATAVQAITTANIVVSTLHMAMPFTIAFLIAKGLRII